MLSNMLTGHATRTGRRLRLPSATGMIRQFAHALQVHRERRALAALDDRMLKDIGLSRSTAHKEANRALFDVADIENRQMSRVRRFRTRDLG